MGFGESGGHPTACTLCIDQNIQWNRTVSLLQLGFVLGAGESND